MAEYQSLSRTQQGKTVQLSKINGRGAALQLAEMGLNRDVCIKIIKNTGNGPILVSFRGTRVMIGRGLSEKIRVVETN